MDSVVKTMNQIQTALFSVRSSVALQLPQIAVVGSQSSGKSSVLESVVGKDFLPRGVGIVTRRPLVLQLIRDPACAAEFGQFAHTGQHRFYDFAEIRDEIQRDTDRVCGRGDSRHRPVSKAISDVPINLRIYSPDVVDLTLIDLPGLTKVPIGDQPQDIENQVLELVLRYISQKNCLILAVCQANADLANAEALKVAQLVDRLGERTIGVLTKLDLMDQGTDASEILQNKAIPLKYGYIGVVNRSQQDIDQNKTLDSAVDAERAFFDRNPCYNCVRDRCGITALKKMLSVQLSRHIVATLPSLRLKLEEHLWRMQGELDDGFAEAYFRPDDSDWQVKTLMLLLMRFAENFRTELLGNSSDFVDVFTASCGTSIQRIFRSKFPQLLSVVDWTDESEMKRSIAFAIKNTVGVRVGIFTPDRAFEETVRSQIVKLKDPVFVVVDMVLAETLQALRKCLEVFKAFARLQEIVEASVNCRLMQQAERVREELAQLFDYELAYINSNHDDFVGFHQAEMNVLFRRRQPGSQLVKQGYLTMSTGGALTLDRRYWFELTPNNLVWYSDETKADRRYVLPIDEHLQLRSSRRMNRLVLFHSQDKNIFKDSSRIELSAASSDEAAAWKRKMIDVGIFEQETTATTKSDGVCAAVRRPDRPCETSDPHLERQVEVIWLLLDSYMKIVTNNMCNMVPKVIVKTLIKETITYVRDELIVSLSRGADGCAIDQLMEVDPEKLRRLRELQATRDALLKAMECLGGVHIDSGSSLANRFVISRSSGRTAFHPRPELVHSNSMYLSTSSSSPAKLLLTKHLTSSSPRLAPQSKDREHEPGYGQNDVKTSTEARSKFYCLM